MERQKETRAQPLAVIIIVVLLMLPVFYVLSVGPAVWLISQGYLDDGAARWFYGPLEWLAERSEMIRSCFQWYVSLFLDRPK